MAVASLVLAIAGLCLSWEGVSSVVGLACSILAIVFGNKAKNAADENQQMAKAGRVIGWISVILSIIGLIIFIILFALFGVAIFNSIGAALQSA